MPLPKPKARKSRPPNAVASIHLSLKSLDKLMYCLLDDKGNLWCKGYELGDLWETYAYDLGSRAEEYARLIGKKTDQGSLF